jgi:hypothetical protein
MVENRGGYRPTAPQNNPKNVNGLGGNGQSGMNTDYTGFPHGVNKEINDQRTAMPITSPTAPETVSLPSLTPLNAPTQRPDEHISTGMPFNNTTPGVESLGLPAAGTVQYQTARDAIQSLANDPDAGPAIKYLADKIGRAY